MWGMEVRGVGNEKDVSSTGGLCNIAGFDCWVTGLFLLFLASLGGAATVILFWDGNGRAILIALLAAVTLWSLEQLETRHRAGPTRAWHRFPHYLAPVVVIFLVTCTVYLPSRNAYFFEEDFGYLHFFQTPSLRLFLNLCHSDIAQLVWREARQELRPFFDLYYTMGYRVWGLNPLGYHLSGILLHILNAIIVFRIADELAPGKPWRAGFAGLLFAVQPIHAYTLSLILFLVADVFPTFLYLVSFWCFMRFRATRLARYLAFSAVAFGVCLMCKEIAVTLPAMLVSYDLLRKHLGEGGVSASSGSTRKKSWWGGILSYLPFAGLLVAYLALRRFAFGSFLREGTWARTWSSYLPEGLSTPHGFLQHLVRLGRYLETLQAFYLRRLLLPFPVAILGLALGLYLVWALSLVRRRPECRGSIVLILYFGLVWYGISNLPLLVVSPVSRYLYLPAVGPCIATALFAFPAFRQPPKEAKYLRLLGAVFLVCLSASLVWKENTQWARVGEISRRMTEQFSTAIADVPKQALVIIPDAEDNSLPYPLQTPFASTDLYSRVRIIELPYACAFPLSQWWKKTKLALGTEMAGRPDEAIEIYLLAWDERSGCLQQRKRMLPRGLLRACVIRSLGGTLETVDSLGYSEGGKLVESLARLVSEGGQPPK